MKTTTIWNTIPAKGRGKTEIKVKNGGISKWSIVDDRGARDDSGSLAARTSV